MKFFKIFLVLFSIFIIAYLAIWVGVTNGLTWLAPFMFPVGLGLGGFFLMMLICLIFKK